MKKLLTISALFVFTLSVKSQSGKAMKYDTARYIERYIRGVGGDHFVNLRMNTALFIDSVRKSKSINPCQHIWVDVVSDTVINKAPGISIGIYSPPPEWQQANQIVCLLCKNIKNKVIHNIGFDGLSYRDLMDTTKRK